MTALVSDKHRGFDDTDVYVDADDKAFCVGHADLVHRGDGLIMTTAWLMMPRVTTIHDKKYHGYYAVEDEGMNMSFMMTVIMLTRRQRRRSRISRVSRSVCTTPNANTEPLTDTHTRELDAQP